MPTRLWVVQWISGSSYLVYLKKYLLRDELTIIMPLFRFPKVRADMKELRDLDLGGAPYGYTPFCDSREDMEGFRFWKRGYWAHHLGHRRYHIRYEEENYDYHSFWWGPFFRFFIFHLKGVTWSDKGLPSLIKTIISSFLTFYLFSPFLYLILFSQCSVRCGFEEVPSYSGWWPASWPVPGLISGSEFVI